MDRAGALTAGAALVVIVAGLGTTGAAAADDPPSCRDVPATIVGEPGKPVLGTDGDDVIYAWTPSSLDAGAGDDRVCIVPPSYSRSPVLAGDGDDDVFVLSSVGDLTKVDLGAGRDTLVGYDGQEEVVTDGPTSELDVVTTNGLADTVVSGVEGQPNPDRIELGGGDDTLVWRGLAHEDSSLDGEGGTDTFLPVVDVVRVDTRHHRVRTDNGRSARFHGFERHVLRGVVEATFVGGLESDDVVLVDVRLGIVRLGPGDDRLVVKRSCLLHARGDADSDRLYVRQQDCNRTAKLSGNGGDDRLSGSPQRDVLTGGSGRDLADGRGGKDTCEAEVRRSCELSP